MSVAAIEIERRGDLLAKHIAEAWFRRHRCGVLPHKIDLPAVLLPRQLHLGDGAGAGRPRLRRFKAAVGNDEWLRSDWLHVRIKQQRAIRGERFPPSEGDIHGNGGAALRETRHRQIEGDVGPAAGGQGDAAVEFLPRRNDEQRAFERLFTRVLNLYFQR